MCKLHSERNLLMLVHIVNCSGRKTNTWAVICSQILYSVDLEMYFLFIYLWTISCDFTITRENVCVSVYTMWNRNASGKHFVGLSTLCGVVCLFCHSATQAWHTQAWHTLQTITLIYKTIIHYEQMLNTHPFRFLHHVHKATIQADS